MKTEVIKGWRRGSIEKKKKKKKKKKKQKRDGLGFLWWASFEDKRGWEPLLTGANCLVVCVCVCVCVCV